MMMNWEERGLKQIQPNNWYYPAIYLEGRWEDTKHLTRCNQFDG
jgi:hypothetical protein